MSSAPRYTPHYTVDDYRQWKGDWELWNGAAVAMTPSPFGRHGAMLARLVTALTNGLDSAGCDASVLAEIDWIIAEDTVVRPDATVICGEPPEGHVESPPAIVVEVLSAATRERDLNHKRVLYQTSGVPWYLIADPDDSSINILKRNDQTATIWATFGNAAGYAAASLDFGEDPRQRERLVPQADGQRRPNAPPPRQRGLSPPFGRIGC